MTAWLIRIAGATIIIVIVALAYTASLDVNRYKDELVEFVEERTGRAVYIHGDIHLKLSWVPTLAVERVAFGNAKWAAHENMVTIQRIEARLAIMPLLHGDVVLKRLAISGGRISIETNRREQGNWILELEERDDPIGSASTLPRFDLDEVELLGTTIEYRAYGRDVKQAAIEKLTLKSEGFGQPLSLDTVAAYQDLKIELSGRVSRLRRLLADEPYAIDLSGSAGGVGLSIKGDLQKPLRGQNMKLEIKLQASQLATLAAPFGISLAERGPAEFAAILTDTRKGYALGNLQMRAAESRLAGSLLLELSAGRWQVEGDLKASRIDIADFVRTTDAAAAPARLFPSERHSLAWLNALEGQLDVVIESLVSDGAPITDLRGRLTIDDGALEIKPLVAKIGDGSLSAAIDIDASGELPQLELDLEITAMSLASWPKLARGGRVSNGPTDVSMKLQGRGGSVAAIMAGADGLFAAKIGAAVIKNDAAGIAGSDLVMSLFNHLNPMSRVDSRTMLECAAIRFPIVNGIARNEAGIGVQTRKLSILGGGTINLKSEGIDIGVRPKPREGLGLNLSSLVDFVRLGGTLANPRPATDAKGAATAGLKVGAAVATAGLSVLAEGLFDRATANEDVCAIAQGKAPLHTSSDHKGRAPSLLDSTKSKTKGVIEGAGAKVKGVFKGLFGD